MAVGGRCHTPAALLPAERPGAHCTGWVGPRVSMDGAKQHKFPNHTFYMALTLINKVAKFFKLSYIINTFPPSHFSIHQHQILSFKGCWQHVPPKHQNQHIIMYGVKTQT
jgi:hypothetical protein